MEKSNALSAKPLPFTAFRLLLIGPIIPQKDAAQFDLLDCCAKKPVNCLLEESRREPRKGCRNVCGIMWRDYILIPLPDSKIMKSIYVRTVWRNVAGARSFLYCSGPCGTSSPSSQDNKKCDRTIYCPQS
jgi:hypothetical protein